MHICDHWHTDLYGIQPPLLAFTVFHVSILSFHIWLLNFNFDADPDLDPPFGCDADTNTAFHSETDPASKNGALLWSV